jgi:hypothetical protein
MLVFTTRAIPSAARNDVVPERPRDGVDRRVRRAGVERDAAAQEVRGIEESEHQVRVGDRGARAALAVAGWAGRRPRALRADVEDSARVDPRHRAAAGAQRVDVDRRQRDFRDADGLFAGQLRLATLEERDVGRRAAHVERDEAGLVDESRAVASGGDAAGRPRQHRAGGQARRLAHRRHAAVRLDDQDVAAVAVLREPRREILEIARQRRTDVRVDDGRPHALVFLDLRQDVARERDVGARQAPRDGASRELSCRGFRYECR